MPPSGEIVLFDLGMVIFVFRHYNTWKVDPWSLKMRSPVGWKQDNIWAACLGLADDAAQLNYDKMANGPVPFPGFL